MRSTAHEKAPRLGIAILQWNHLTHTNTLLNDLKGQLKPDIKTVVCDNGSDADCWSGLVTKVAELDYREVERSQDWGISLVRNSNNSGFAAGMNLAIKQLLKEKCEWIWILNNDVRIQEGVIEQLLLSLHHKPPGLYGTMFGKKSDIKPGLIRYNRWQTTFKHISKEQLDGSCDISDTYLDGASMLVHHTVFQTVGLLSENTFIYFEELDFAKRVREHNFDFGVLSDVCVEHIGGGSSSDRTSSASRITMYHETWSTLAFTKAYYPILFVVILMFRAPARILSLIVKARFREIPFVLSATWDFLRGLNRDKRPIAVSDQRYFF